MTKSFFLPSVLSAMLALSLSACSSGTHDLQNSHSVPAAAGEVKAKKGDNGNTEVNVKVEHLAHPGNVEADRNTYVVWAKDDASGQVTNLGALKVDKDLTGHLDTVTPFRNFDLFVTPESQSAAAEPTGEHLLWTRINED